MPEAETVQGAPALDAQAATWVARVCERDARALAALYDATVERVHAIALRVLGDAGDAEEAVADVYTHVWERAHRYDAARGGVLAWIAMLAHSRAIDRRRRRGDTLPLVTGEEAELALVLRPSETAAAFDLVDTLERGHRLREAMTHLTPAQRQLIGLAFLHDLSHPEIAAHTGLPLGTVKSHIRRGLEALRRALEDDVP